MPNSEYLRLKALLDSNPQYKIMLNTISKAEGTWGKDAYSTTYGGGKSDWKKGKDKTVRNNSSAHGKYQFMNDTWKRLTDSLGLSGFSPEEQDVAAMKLLEEKNALKHIDNGEMDKAIFAAAPVWAALPKDASGKSAMSGQKAKPLSTVLRYAKSNEAARAAINDGYKIKSESAAREYLKAYKQMKLVGEYEEKRSETYKFVKSKERIEKEKSALKSKYEKEFDRLENTKLPENKKSQAINNLIKEYDDQIEEIVIPEKYQEKERIKLFNQKEYENIYVGDEQSRKIVEKNKTKIDSYWNEIKKIQHNKNLSEAEKNAQKNTVKQKYYREGLLGVINVESHENFLEKNALIKELESASKHVNLEDGYGGTLDFDEIKYSKIKEKLKKVGITIPKIDKNKKSGLFEGGPLADLKKVVEDVKKLNVDRMEPGILKYGKTKNEYDAEVTKTTPIDDGESSTNTPDATDTPDGSTNQTPEEKTKTEEVAKKQAELDKKNGYDGSDILGRFDDTDQYADTPFQFSKGKQQIPFDALIGLTAGMVGAAQADDVEIKYRDEQIAEGMLQYAQDIERIKNIGLDPAIEGSLKQKLADAYQTGLENTVRASNGNRNLVLGNQGQLDKARMEGIVDIVAMDIDRSDKALAAFGEVQKYISEFEANKSIANNERKYQEDQKRQMAGMQLASAGMGNFIDAIQNAKENAPGSINDMKRQYFQFAATGLLPNAEEGKPGSLSHRNALIEKNKLFTEKKRTYRDWINSKNQEDRNLIAKILEKNPQQDPTINKSEGENATDFAWLENKFNTVSGTDENRLAYFNDKGISVLDASKAATATSEVSAADKAKIDEQAKLGKKAVLTTTGTPVVGGGGATVPVVGQKQTVPDGTIITKDNLAEKTKLDQLNLGANGLPTGPETISDIENANALNIEEYNFLNKPQ
jgi:muramidase (phage lysozyme)